MLAGPATALPLLDEPLGESDEASEPPVPMAFPEPAPVRPDPPAPAGRTGRAAVGVIAVLVIALVAVTALQVGGASSGSSGREPASAPQEPSGPTSPTSPTTVSVAEAAPPVPTTLAQPLPTEGRPDPLAANVYRAPFQPAFTFSLEEGWRQTTAPGNAQVFLEKLGGNAQSLSFLKAEGVFDAHGGPNPAVQNPAPRDLLGWLRGHPRLAVEEASPLTIAGRSATRVDLSVRTAASYRVDRCGTCVLVFRGPGAELVFGDFNRTRLYLVPFEAYTVVIAAEARPGEADAFFGAVERVVASVTFS